MLSPPEFVCVCLLHRRLSLAARESRKDQRLVQIDHSYFVPLRRDPEQEGSGRVIRVAPHDHGQRAHQP